MYGIRRGSRGGYRGGGRGGASFGTPRFGGSAGSGRGQPPDRPEADVAELLAGLSLRSRALEADPDEASVNRRAEARRLLLGLQRVAPKPVPTRGGVDVYLRGCFTNILAEFWGFFSGKTGRFPGWRRKLLDEYEVKVRADERGVLWFAEAHQVVFNPRTQERGSEEAAAPLDDLASSLVVFQGKLYFANLCNKEGVRRVELYAGTEVSSLDELGLRDDLDAKGEKVLFSFGSINNFMCELAAVLRFIKSDLPIPALLRHIADPTSRAVCAYADRGFAAEVPHNNQQESIIRGLRHTVEAIQGPPGTGKSTTIFHILYSRLPPGVAALVTCVQNKAVDSVAEKLGPVIEQVPFIVLGQEKNLGASAAAYTLGQQVERDPKVVTLRCRLERVIALSNHFADKIRSKEGSRFGDSHDRYRQRRLHEIIQQYEQRKGKLSMLKRQQLEDDWLMSDPCFVRQKHPLLFHARKYARARVQELSAMLTAEKARVREALIESARAVLCTVDTASQLTTSEELSPLCERVSFVVLDEAGTMPEHKVPLMVQTSPSVIIAVGDQMQLSAFTHCNDSWGGGKKPANSEPVGFFQRIEKALPSGSVPMLSIQYRMHPRICDFVSATFYDGRLTTADITANMRNAQVALPQDAVLHVGYSSRNAESGGTRNKTSKQNETEADLIISMLRRLDDDKSVMVITFYKEQMRLLHSQAKDANIIFNTKESLVRIVTVDAAQGSEADIVILSCVRSNPELSVGFLSNENRMCVATSRARQRTIIVGCASTLSSSKKWAKLLRHAKASSVSEAQEALRN